jgi:hypothetical protein
MSTCATALSGKMLKEPSDGGSGMGTGVGVLVGGSGVLVGGGGVLVGGCGVLVGADGVSVGVAGDNVNVLVGSGEIWAKLICETVVSATSITAPNARSITICNNCLSLIFPLVSHYQYNPVHSTILIHFDMIVQKLPLA